MHRSIKQWDPQILQLISARVAVKGDRRPLCWRPKQSWDNTQASPADTNMTNLSPDSGRDGRRFDSVSNPELISLYSKKPAKVHLGDFPPESYLCNVPTVSREHGHFLSLLSPGWHKRVTWWTAEMWLEIQPVQYRVASPKSHNLFPYHS